MKGVISLLLLACMLLGTLMLVGCPAPDDDGTTTTTKPNGGGEQPSEWADSLDTAAIRKEIGDTTDIVISCGEQYAYEIYAEEDSKGSLDQLIYKRNKKIEERFGVTITPDVTKRVGEVDLTSHLQYAQAELRGMNPNFDLLSLQSARSGSLIGDGYYRNWRTAVPYARDSLAAGDEWWPEDMNRNLTIKGKQFVAVSDLSITLIDEMFIVLFNESIVERDNIASAFGQKAGKNYTTMYDIVKDGKWTLDTMIDITKDLWYDHEQIGTPGAVDTEDVIGFYNSGGSEIDNFAYSFGFHPVDNDGVGDPSIWVLPSSYDTIVTKLRNFFNNSVGGHKGGFGYTYEARSQAFAEGHIVFMTGWLNDFQRESIRGMEDNRGVLPYPKLTEDQLEYKSSVGDALTILSIPKFTTGRKLKLAGAMTVALSAETTKSIVQPYYEMVVKHDSGFVNKAAVEMVDMIMDGRVFDVCITHCSDLYFGEDLMKLHCFLRYLLNTATNQSASGAWESAGPILEGRMRDLIAIYDSL